MRIFIFSSEFFRQLLQSNVHFSLLVWSIAILQLYFLVIFETRLLLTYSIQTIKHFNNKMFWVFLIHVLHVMFILCHDNTEKYTIWKAFCSRTIKSWRQTNQFYHRIPMNATYSVSWLSVLKMKKKWHRSTIQIIKTSNFQAIL